MDTAVDPGVDPFPDTAYSDIPPDEMVDPDLDPGTEDVESEVLDVTDAFDLYTEDVTDDDDLDWDGGEV